MSTGHAGKKQYMSMLIANTTRKRGLCCIFRIYSSSIAASGLRLAVVRHFHFLYFYVPLLGPSTSCPALYILQLPIWSARHWPILVPYFQSTENNTMLMHCDLIKTQIFNISVTECLKYRQQRTFTGSLLKTSRTSAECRPFMSVNVSVNNRFIAPNRKTSYALCTLV